MLLINKTKEFDGLRQFLKEVRFDFVLKAINPLGYYIEPWIKEENFEGILAGMDEKYELLYGFFVMGKKVCKADFIDYFGEKIVNILLEVKFAKEIDDKIYSDGYSILSSNDLLLLVSTPFYYDNCKEKYSDTYIGGDSLRLGTFLDKSVCGRVLDLCAGSGIQGLILADRAEKVTSVELNPKAIDTIKVNAILNGFAEKVDVRSGNLYEAIKDGEAFDYIVSNPPFVAVPENIKYPMCGDGGIDGLDIVKEIINGYSHYLNDGGRATMFLEGLGDEYGPFLVDYLNEMVSKEGLDFYLVLHSRQTIETQTEIIVDLTSKLNEGSSPEELSEQWMALYEKLGASFLYSMTLDCFKKAKSENGNVEVLNCCNPWNGKNVPILTHNFTVEKYSKYFSIWKDGRRIAVVDEDTNYLLAALGKDKTTREIAEELYTNSDRSKSFAKVFNDVLNVCNYLERLGIVKK